MDKFTEIKVSPCVGCGFCCMQTPCDASRRLYSSAESCPQLQWSEKANRYYCGLMRIAGKVGEGYRHELHAGAGCCSNLNTWRKDVKNRSRGEAEYKFGQIPTIFQAFLKAFGAEPFMSGDTTVLMLHRYEHELQCLDYSEDEVKHIMRNVVHYITSNKTSMCKGFMP